MNIEKKLSHVEFLNREYNITHMPYENEMAFYRSIKEGNLEEARKRFRPINKVDMGILSDDELRNLKYHFIISVALITRYCIEGGMEGEAAYNLSDIYIRSMDKCQKEEEVAILLKEAVDDYTQRMHIIRKQNRYPKAVILCLEYIYENLHTKISLEKLAEITGLTPAYVSKLFHKEVGKTVSEYVTAKRVEAAENMLKYSEYTCLEISDYLCFSSESYFIQVFRKHTGYTPKNYRERFFRTHWE